MFASYVTALSSLNIAANVGEEDRVFLNFSLDILDALGFGLNSLRCERCGEALGDDVFFRRQTMLFIACTARPQRGIF